MFFTTLQRYVLKQFLLTLGSILIVLLGFFVLVRFTEEVNTFVAIADTTPFIVFVKYFVYEMPYTLNYLFPLGVMFTTVFVLGRLNATRELFIYYTSGRGMLYHTFPIMLFLLFTCTIFLVFDKELFYVLHIKHRVLGRELKSQTFFKESERVDFVQFGSDNKIYLIGGFDPVRGGMRDVYVIFLSPYNYFRSLFIAKEGNHLGEGDWAFEGTHTRDLTKEPIEYLYEEQKELALNEEPYHFDRVYLGAEDLSARELKQQAEKVELIGGNARKWWTEYYFKLANPYIAVVMFLFAIPLSIFSSSAVVVLSFFLVLMTAFVYMVLMNIGVSLGHSGVLPPLLAGWLGNIVFFILSVVLYLRFRK